LGLSIPPSVLLRPIESSNEQPTRSPQQGRRTLQSSRLRLARGCSPRRSRAREPYPARDLARGRLRVKTRRIGIPARLGMALRLFETRSAQPLRARPSGTLRVAEETDLPTIATGRRPLDPTPSRTIPPILMRRHAGASAVGVYSSGTMGVPSRWLPRPVGPDAVCALTLSTRRQSIDGVDSLQPVWLTSRSFC
jgi:hypothetical protein